MGILISLKRYLHTKQKAFEISSDNGLISIYALCRARGEGGSQTQS